MDVQVIKLFVWLYEHVQVKACLCSINSCFDCYLFGLESRWDPCVLLGGTARVVVGDGVSLEVWYQFRHHLFQLARHRAHGMLLSHTLAVHTDLPVETRTELGLHLWGLLKTDLHHESKLLKCQIFQYISAVGSPGALGTKVTFEPQSRLPVSSAKAEIPKIYYNMIIIARFN